MDDETQIDSPLVEKKLPTGGEWLLKTLKPLGCILVLCMAALAIIICLTAGNDPIKGYQPPQSDAYYATHLDALQAELEANVFPALDGVESCRIEDGQVRIEIAYSSFAITRSALLRYFDSQLFNLVQLPAQSNTQPDTQS